ncbi:MAG: sialidase family protein [Ignavibacteria bacterium]
MYNKFKNIIPALISLLIFGSGFVYLNLSKKDISKPEIQMSPKKFLFKEKFGAADKYTSKDISHKNELTNVRINDLPGASEPVVRCSPVNDQSLIVSANDFSIDENKARIFISENKGLDWKAEEIELSECYITSSYSDPWIEYDNYGQLYFTAIQYDLHKNVNEGIFFARSDDNGLNWTSGKNLLVSNTTASVKIDKPKIFISKNNALYIFWTEISGYKSHIKLILSKDKGETFSDPIILTDNKSHFSSMIEDKEGNIYLAYVNDGKSIKVVRSFDKGIKWNSIKSHLKINVAGKSVENKNILKSEQNSGIRINSEPSLELSSEGEILITYSAKGAVNDLSDIYYTKLVNENSEFTIPVRVNSDDTENDQYQPLIAADENGLIYIFYQDSRNDINNILTESYISVSSDGGKTFTDKNLSTNPYSPSEIAVEKYFGDYNSFVVSEKQIIAVWTDGRNGNFDVYAGIINKDQLIGN